MSYTKTSTLVLLLIFICGWSYGQTCPPNIDFEQGTFANWQCFTGYTYVDNNKNVIDLSVSGPLAYRHQIISRDSTFAKDEYGAFPKLCPYGGNYSIKLGNDNVGAEAEGISYTFTVPPMEDTFTITYFYAVVFQDPGHDAIEQPRFFVTAYDVLTGDLIDCASYNYIATSSLPGFKVSKVDKEVLYKDWSPVSIQFINKENRQVRIEMKTADCTQTGHFGYAYLDVGTGCSNILASAPYCKETNSIILNAPYGFETYIWYNETFTTIIGGQQSITLSPPPATTGTYYVDMIPYPGFGCRDTAIAIVNPLPVPDTPQTQSNIVYCQYDYVSELTATAIRGNDLIWYTDSVGGQGSFEAPLVSTAKTGTFYFYVTQKVLLGCESRRKKITVVVQPTPTVSFSINDARQCQNGNQFDFINTSSNLSSSTYSWDFGEQPPLIETTKDASHSYANDGNYWVNLKVTNDGKCTKDITKMVAVIPKPVADFDFPPVICEQQTSLILQDKSYVPNGIGTLSSWWWNIGGKIVRVKNPVPFLPTVPGNMQVRLVAITAEGCTSDTNTKVLTIHYRPKAVFKNNSTLFCDNEILHFTNQSSMPSGASPEYIANWQWKFDNNQTSLEQHPTLLLPAGPHHATLLAETNFGCKSQVADSAFIVYPKPEIRLQINDSCVFRKIKYDAIDVLHTVDKWYWKFDGGLIPGSNSVTKTFQHEGYNPLTLIGQTIHGCKDTLKRPFTIFDNKANAGRDTTVAIDQPVLLISHGGPNVTYNWSPPIGLNNANLENPTATWHLDQLYQLDAITDKGCDSHSKIFIKRMKGPDFYIPTAFTPNLDGHNDVLHVIPVGIKFFISFSVYNRYGQQVFFTTDLTQGWDGNIKGNPAFPENYVAVAKATDYDGKAMMKSVNVMLIR